MTKRAERERETLLRDPDDALHDNTVDRTETDKTLDKLSNEPVMWGHETRTGGCVMFIVFMNLRDDKCIRC